MAGESSHSLLPRVDLAAFEHLVSKTVDVEMNLGTACDGIEKHGTALDDDKRRVQCRYCMKEVNGFSRLRHHLGGVGNDVSHCTDVPEYLKLQVRTELLGKKHERLVKEVGKLQHPELPLKRNVSPVLLKSHIGEKTLAPSNPLKKLKQTEKNSADSTTLVGSTSSPQAFFVNSAGNRTRPIGSSAEEGSSISIQQDTGSFVKDEPKDESAVQLEQSIAGFFYEAGLDSRAINLPSFKNLIDAAIKYGAGFQIPTSDALNGSLLQLELEAIHQRAAELRQCWEVLGCSILVDRWNNSSGSTFYGFFVQCPNGILFLRSVDASDLVNDVDSLRSLLSDVIDEVGAEHVVQVITNDPSPYMQAAEAYLKKKYTSTYFTVCVDFCINLILTRIADLMDVERVLDTAEIITSSINDNVPSLQQLKILTHGMKINSASNLKFVGKFLCLKNLLSEREKIEEMLASTLVNTSVSSSGGRSMNLSELVKDSDFWSGAALALKVTDPLIGILDNLNIDKCPMGHIYDAMDRAKETIKTNLGSSEARYVPYWEIIDDIWNNYIHNSLHSAGYYLNPGLWFSGKVAVDAEVSTGLLHCVVHMVKSQADQGQISNQLQAYGSRSGAYSEDLAIEQSATLEPKLWWSVHAEGSPHLRNLARRILSQPCCGASRFNLNKATSERVHAAKNDMERKLRRDLEYVQQNRLLTYSGSLHGGKFSTTG